jgi:cellulose synthase (UDP-forming)
MQNHDAEAAAHAVTSAAPAGVPLGPVRVALVTAYAAAALAYLSWRALTLDLAHPAFSLAFLAAEIASAAGLLLSVFVVRRMAVRAPEAAPEGLSVDVFVTTAGEPAAVVRRTLLAARAMAYPHQTWLLDDGNDDAMGRLARELGVRYVARPEAAGGRAGGLNNGLRYSRAALVAVFDAHHAPARNFLVETLGYFRDPRLAFVQTPLEAYNLDSFLHRCDRQGIVVWNEQTLESRVVQRARDCDNAVLMQGTCVVLRRAALDHVRGFAAATQAEDLHTSVRLHEAGWRSAYHPRALAFGMAPASIGPYLDRYLRRGAGAVEVWRRERLLGSRHLTRAQKAAYLDAVLGHFAGWRKAVYYLAPIAILTTGVLPFDLPVRTFVAAFLAFHLLGFWVRAEAGRGYARVLCEEQFQMARFGASIAATLAPLVGVALHGLPRATTPGAAPHAWPFVLPQGALLLGSAAAIPAGVAMHFRAGVLPHDALVAAAVAAALVGALAASVLASSARHAAYRRREYRFRVPVPARLSFPRLGRMLGVFDDVSASGFRFYGRLPQQLDVGSRVNGDIFLPSGTIPFSGIVRAEIVAEGARHVKGIGCSFEWDAAARRDALEGHLFGTDLQWAINSLEDRIATPLEHLGRLASRAPRPAAPAHWAPALYEHAANTLAPPRVGVVAVGPHGDSPHRLATLAPLDTRRPLRLRVVTRTGSHAVTGQPVADRCVETAAEPVFLYRLA